MVKNLLIKVILTALLMAWAVYPYLSNTADESVLAETFKIGVLPAVIIAGCFLVMVALYCRTLEKCLSLVKPENRAASPKSVWYMFAMPFNFVEDFFIVIHVANSLEAERSANPELKSVSDTGMVSGIGWSIAQVLSFIPSIVGQAAGLAGMVLMLCHWVQIARINKLLSKA